ncbi:MAG: hypothetical protein QM753_10790 [Thermomicrobiales bacterium]
MRLRLSSVAGAFVLFAMLAFGGPAGALAQATPEASPDFRPDDLPGFQQGIARSYSADLSALFATPTTAEATPDYASLGVVTLSTVILAFDSEDSAASTYDTVVQQVTSPASTGGIELKELTVQELSGPTNAYTASIEQGEGLTLHQVVLLTQDGPYIYQTIAIALSTPEDAQAFAVAVAQAMIAAPAGEGEGTFSQDGTSTGGAWDKFPKTGDPVLKGLSVEMDDRFEPATGVSTPQA